MSTNTTSFTEAKSTVIPTKTIWQSILPWIVVSIGGIFYCYAYFLRVSPSEMMSALMLNFHINATQFGNLAAFYYYSYTPMQLPVGVIVDRYGARFVLFTACLLAAIGVFLFTIAHSFFAAALGRFLVGFGSAFAYITVLKLAALWLPSNRFAMVAGGTTALGMGAAIISDIYLANFVQSIGYKNALVSSIIIGAILSVLIFLIVRDRPSNSDQNIFQAGLTFKTLFKGFRKIIKSQQIWLIGILGCLMYMPASVFLDLWGVPYLESAYQLTPERASEVISMIFVGWILSAPAVGALSDRIKLRRLPLTIACFGAALLISYIFYVPNVSINTLFFLFLLFGMFCGAHPLIFSLSRENFSNKLSGTATATTNFIVMLGGVVFQPAVGLLLDLHWKGVLLNNTRVYTLHDYQFALSILPIGLLLGGLATFCIKETHCRIKE